MRKVVLYTLMSVDGAVEDPTRYFSVFDEEMDAHLGRVIGAQDTVLLGRRMYDEWSQHWPNSDDQPFADFINNVRKYVFTSSTPTTAWAHTTVATASVADLVAELKATPGGDIGVHGSIDLARSMLRAGLIDQLSLVIAPTLSGIGRRLFDAELFDERQGSAARAAAGGRHLVGWSASRLPDRAVTTSLIIGHGRPQLAAMSS